jgi:hypothetical protein
MTELDWKAAMNAATEAHTAKLQTVDDLNESAIQALALVYQAGFKDCLLWLKSAIKDG